MLLSPWFLAITLVLIAVASIPTRRLFVAGAGRRMLATYLCVLVALGLVAAAGIGLARFALACFAAVFSVPLIVPSAVVRRLLRPGAPTVRDRPHCGVDGAGRMLRSSVDRLAR